MTGAEGGGVAEAVHARVARAGWWVGSVSGLAVLVAALSMQPLVDGAWWLPPTFATVLGVVVMGGLVRTLGLPAPLQPLLQAGALLVMLTLLFANEVAVWGFLPGPGALRRLQELAAEGRAYAEATVPPAGVDEGLLLIIVAGVGLVALAVDTLAAGLDLPGLTLIPLGALFAVPWLINRGSAPGWAFVLVAVGWLGLLSAAQRGRAALWSPEARPGSAGAGAAVAAVTTALALLAGGLTALRDPVGPVTGIGGPGGTVELDALVSLRRSLVNQDDRIVLTFAASTDRTDYLRLAVLERFDGAQWSPAPASPGQQPPPGSAADGGSGNLVEYRLDVGPLTGETLPSPTGTIASLNDWPVSWDQRTSLPQRTDGGTIEGTRIGLLTAPPTWDATGLRSASLTATPADPVLAENSEDPTDLVGPELGRVAREVTAGATSPYDAAVALQQWFTSDGEFTYSTDVQAGSGENALNAFLTDRIGYCEQFSATMALMARALGIPARVVVGFTQGRRDGTQWVVRGTDAHAWPELWMGAAGWVRFEPTPGAPTTSTPGYTRAAEATQAPSEAPDTATAAPDEQSTDAPAQAPDIDTGAVPVGGAESAGGRLAQIVLALLAVGLLVPATLRWARRRRRQRWGDGEAAYREVADTLVDVGLGTEGPTPRATLGVVAARVGDAPGPDPVEAREAIGRIQRAVEWQRYGAGRAPGDVGPAHSGPAHAGAAVLVRTRAAATPGSLAADVRAVNRALRRRAGWPRRVLAAALPRSVFPTSRGDESIE